MSQRIAAQIARELTRRELEQEGDEEDDEDDEEYDPEKDSDNGLDDDDDENDDGENNDDKKRRKNKKRRRKGLAEGEVVVESVALTDARNVAATRRAIEAKQQAEEIFKQMQQHHHRPLGVLHIPYKPGEDGSGGVDPLLASYCAPPSPTSSSRSAIGEEALQLAKSTLQTVGMTDYVDNVKFAGEVITLARRLEKTEAKAKEEAAVAVSGLDRMVAALARKKGISTVEKTSIDWEKYKHEKHLEEELRNASRAGVVDKEAFLGRVDARQFELEKAERERARAKRDMEAAREKAGL